MLTGNKSRLKRPTAARRRFALRLLDDVRSSMLRGRDLVKISIAALLKTKPTLTRNLSPAAFVALVAVISPTTAQAHAHLDHAIPAAGVVVHVPPAQIELSFSEAVEPSFSTVEVLDQAGGHAERGKPEIDPGDAKLLRIKIKLTAPGVYKVVWRVLSLDTHRSSGSFTFTLAP